MYYVKKRNETLDQCIKAHAGHPIRSIEMAVFWGLAYHEDELADGDAGYGPEFDIVDEDGLVYKTVQTPAAFVGDPRNTTYKRLNRLLGT